MALLDDIFIAHGGIHRWRSLCCFTVHFSINGGALAWRGGRGARKELEARGSTRTPSLGIVGFPAPDRRSDYRADGVTIEMLDGTHVARRDDPRSALHGRANASQRHFCSPGLTVMACLDSATTRRRNRHATYADH